MHVANIKPKRSWTKLEDLVTEAIGETGTLAEGKTYEFYNNGGCDLHVEEVQYGDKIKLSTTHCASLDMHGSVLDIHD